MKLRLILTGLLALTFLSACSEQAPTPPEPGQKTDLEPANGAAGETDQNHAIASAGSVDPKRPNIIFIMSDDHAHQAIGAYGSKINSTPNIDRLASEGIRFDRSYVSNSICSPARAAVLTGKHSHINGVRDNVGVFDGSQQTFPKLLQANGYQTALVGKWHLKSEPTGFDFWRVLPGQGFYYQPEFRTPEGTEIIEGYVTDIVTDLAIDWMEQARNSEQPFLLMVGNKAPHREWLPAQRHLQDFKDAPVPEPESLFDDYQGRGTAAATAEMRISDHMGFTNDGKLDPELVKDLGYADFMDWYERNYRKSRERMTDEERANWDDVFGPINEAFAENRPQGDDLTRWKYQRYMQDYLGSINSVDENVGRLLDFLDSSGLAENTIVIYTSDQGFYLGEHGWFDKRFMYEESFRTPLIMRWPSVIDPGSVSEALVQNIDVAPTLLEVAGVPVPDDIHGLSMKPLMTGESTRTHDALYYHYYEYPGIHTVKRHYGIATDRYKLIHFYYDIDEWELYDLQSDPQEMTNLYGQPGFEEIASELKQQLADLREHYGDSDELTQSILQSDLVPDFVNQPANTMTEEEEAEGFRLLFDGESISQFRGFKRDDVPLRWQIEDGLLTVNGDTKDRADLVTVEQFKNFELRLQWKVEEAGNSGIMFNVVEAPGLKATWHSGPEIQILDNYNHNDAVEKHLAGDLYDLLPGWYRMGRPHGEWHESVLRVEDGRVQHWLNGLLVIDTVLGTPAWDELVAGSKFADMPYFGKAREGHIALQDHGERVWFRSIRIRDW